MNYLPTKLNILATFMAFSKLIHMHGSIKIFQNSGTIYSKNYMYKTQPCHPQSTAILHTCFRGPDIAGNISASLLLVWPCCSMLNFFYESNIKTFEPSLEPWKEQRSFTEQYLENMVVGGWLDFGSSPETAVIW